MSWMLESYEIRGLEVGDVFGGGAAGIDQGWFDNHKAGPNLIVGI